MRAKAANGMDVPLKVVGSTVFGRYPKISIEQTFNMIMSDDWGVPFAGYKNVGAISANGNGNTLYKSSIFNHMIAVIDNGVFSIDNDLGSSRIGTIDSSSGQIFIAENNAGQIGISTGKSIFIFDYVANTFQKADTTGWLPGYIAFQDTYFISVDTLTNQWRLSQNNQGLVWPNDPSSIGELQTKPDRGVAAVPFPGKGNLLIVFGKTVSEFWYDVGYALFPYQRSTFYNINYGCLNPATIATEDGIVVWLASNEQSGPVIMYTTGGEPIKISTDGIDFKLASLQYPEDSFAFLFRQDGHLCYQITFVKDNFSYVYDFNVKKFFTLTDEKMDRHIAKKVAFFENKYYFIAFNDGNLYELSSQYADYDGSPIPRVRVCPALRMPDNSPFLVNKLEIIAEQGQQNSLQAIDMSYSKDGGQKFSSYARRNFTAPAVRRNRMKWWSKGYSNEFVTQFRFWGNSRFVIQNGVASVYQ